MKLQSTCSTVLTRLLAGALALLVCTVPAAAGESRVVAVGDLHGNFDGMVQILTETGLIDSQQHWRGGTATLVQIGDIFDRGSQVREIVDLLMQLQEEAADAGGQVIVLLGNHEVMNLLGLLDKVEAEVYQSFVDEHSEQRRAAGYQEFKQYVSRRAIEIGKRPPVYTDEIESRWREQHAPGYLEYLAALTPASPYGRWLRQLPAMVQIGGTLYVHGGVSTELSGLDVATINQQVHAELTAFDEYRARMVAEGMVLPTAGIMRMADALKTEQEILATPVTGSRLDRTRKSRYESLQAVNEWRSWLIMRSEGPVWCRSNARGDETEEAAAEIRSLLAGLGAQRLVIGHTPRTGGRITVRYDGLVFIVDTAIYDAGNRGGLSALEIDQGTVTAVYPEPEPEPGRREVLYEQPCWIFQLLDAAGEPLPLASNQQVMEFLRSARELSRQDIEVGITNPKKLLLEWHGIRAHAVLRQVNVTKQKVNRRRGNLSLDTRDRFIYESAAYEVSEAFAFHRVPPVVPRTVSGREGTLQIWLEGMITEGKRRELNLASPQPGRWRLQWQMLTLFDNLVGNRDRNLGNILIDRSWSIWYIDHTRCFVTVREPASLERVNHCERGVWEALTTVPDSVLKKRLEPFLSPFEIDTLLVRRQRLVKHIRTLIEQRGEDTVLFDLPEALCEPARWQR